MNWPLTGLIILTGVLVIGIGLFAAWWLVRTSRRQLVAAVHYLFDRITLLGTETQRISEDLQVLRELLERRGLVDTEEWARLRQEIIDIPRQRQAEHEQLLNAVKDEEQKERLVHNVPDVLQ